MVRLGAESLFTIKRQVLQGYQQWDKLIDREQDLLGLIKKHGFSTATTNDFETQVDQLQEHVGIALKCLQRDDTKIALLGKTSAGKTMLACALAGYRLLPTGGEHTTSCFVEVQFAGEHTIARDTIKVIKIASDGKTTEKIFQSESWQDTVTEARDYLKIEIDALNIQSDQRVRNDLVIVQVPEWQSQHAVKDMTLVDCPGESLTHSSDAWIQERCRGADLFVYVLNHLGTLDDRDKDRIKELHKAFEIRDLCFVNTMWDSAYDTEEQRTFGDKDNLQQRQNRRQSLCKDVLVGMNLCTAADADKRIFFVSGVEPLRAEGEEPRASTGGPKAKAERKMQFEEFASLVKINGVRKKIESVSSQGIRLETKVQELGRVELQKRESKVDPNIYENMMTDMKTILSGVEGKVKTKFDVKFTDLKKRIMGYDKTTLQSRKPEDRKKFVQELRVFVDSKVSSEFMIDLRKSVESVAHEEGNALIKIANNACEAWGIETRVKEDLVAPLWEEKRAHDMCNDVGRKQVAKEFFVNGGWWTLLAGGGGAGAAAVGGGFIARRIASYGLAALLAEAFGTAVACVASIVSGVVALICGVAFGVNGVFFSTPMVERAIKSVALVLLCAHLLERFQKATESAVEKTKLNILSQIKDQEIELEKQSYRLKDEIQRITEIQAEINNIRSDMQELNKQLQEQSTKVKKLS